MKKILSLALILAFLAVPVFAGTPNFSREGENKPGFTNVASSSADAILIGRPIMIYGATILPSSTNASINIYDNATAASGTVKVEISSATAYTSQHYTFDPPIQMNAGAYVDVTSASAVIEYR